MSDIIPFGRGQSPRRVNRAAPPARSGQPYTDDDHEVMLAMVRAGATHSDIAQKLQRQPVAVLQRMRRLLPPEQRECPLDRVLPALREAAGEPGYDWRAVVLQSPPPPPVHQVVRAGIEGLDEEQLVLITHAVAVLREPAAEPLLQELADTVRRSGLSHRLATAHQQHLRRTDRGSLDGDRDTADAWVAALLGSPPFRPAPWPPFRPDWD